MVIKVLIAILLALSVLILDSFLLPLGAISITLIAVVCLYQKMEWKYLLPLILFMSFSKDILMHSSLGSYILIIGITLGVFLILTMFLPAEGSLVGLIPYFVAFLTYYILITFLPELISFGTWINWEWSIVTTALVQSLVSLVLVILLNSLLVKIRGDKLSSRLTIR